MKSIKMFKACDVQARLIKKNVKSYPYKVILTTVSDKTVLSDCDFSTYSDADAYFEQLCTEHLL